MIVKEATIRMTRDQMLRLGLIRCACGHPPNNHFLHGDLPCAHCNCKGLREEVVVGEVLSEVRE